MDELTWELVRINDDMRVLFLATNELAFGGAVRAYVSTALALADLPAPNAGAGRRKCNMPHQVRRHIDGLGVAGSASAMILTAINHDRALWKLLDEGALVP